jgi:quaternary ammonium compound-resistance protein SugE
MPWIYLLCAGALEIAWAMGLKATQGFTRLLPSLYVLLVGTLSVALLARAAQSLPVGTSYAVWTGLGAAGTAALGMIFLGESRSALRMGCIALIVAGVVGLHLLSKE